LDVGLLRIAQAKFAEDATVTGFAGVANELGEREIREIHLFQNARPADEARLIHLIDDCPKIIQGDAPILSPGLPQEDRFAFLSIA